MHTKEPISANAERPLMLIGGEWRAAAEESLTPIIDPYRKAVASYGPTSSSGDVVAAVEAARRAKIAAQETKAYVRAKWLNAAADLLERDGEPVAEMLTRETGKPISDTKIELRRACEVLRLSAGEAIRIQGEHVPLDATEPGAGKLAMLLPFPVGVIGGILPFNAPINLACHKIGPALASGNTIVIKAPPQCPATIHRLIQIFVAAGIPAGFLNVIYGDGDVGRRLVEAQGVDFISFTGSLKAGASVKAASGMRRVSLELGGIGPTIVHDDADIEAAASTCARNAMRLAGQSCLSVQNVFVHKEIFSRFLGDVVTHVKKMKCGDPLDPTTDVGTLIDEAAAMRVEQWVNEAVRGGAKIVTGGTRDGAFYEPTILTNVRPEMKVVCQEVFGPVMSLQQYSKIDDVVDWLNATEFGLHCGVYTTSIFVAMQCIRHLRAGGVIINGTSTFRTEQQPYGGTKSSGIGREGPRYAIREMTESRLVVFNL